MNPTTSICIPSYESARFIQTTIEPALAQIVPVDQILISDDNSRDGTCNILERYVHLLQITAVRQHRPLGVGNNYQYLGENASSDFVYLLGSSGALSPTFS
jgi:glycosyltransferase involved in cell wall biosynthesis